MKFSIVTKAFFGGFKAQQKLECDTALETANFAIQHLDGRNHALITTFEDGMRDMEFVILLNKDNKDYTMKTNGKYIDVISSDQLAFTMDSRITEILKPLPQIMIHDQEDGEMTIDDYNAKQERIANDKSTKDN